MLSPGGSLPKTLAHWSFLQKPGGKLPAPPRPREPGTSALARGGGAQIQAASLGALFVGVIGAVAFLRAGRVVFGDILGRGCIQPESGPAF